MTILSRSFQSKVSFQKNSLRRLGLTLLGVVLLFLGGVTSALGEVVFSEDFNTGTVGEWPPDWYVDNGIWEHGVPTVGPGDCAGGNDSGEGDYCVGTVLGSNYPPYTDSRLISPKLTLPAVSGAEEIHLRFWQWFAYYPYGVSYSNDYATVQISTDDGQTWTSVGNRIQDYSGGWSLNSIDLTAYAGQQVRIAFYHSEDPDYQSSGWYIDEVTIERFVPDFGDGSFETGWGDWYADRGVWQVGTPTAGPGGCHSGTQCAGTVLNGNYPPYTDSRLISPTITLENVSGAEEIHLRFWQWFAYYPYGVNYSSDYATVQISTDDGQTWTSVGNRIQDYSGGWSLNSIDLTAYAGQQVRIAFYHSEDPDYQSSGWYIDEVTIERFVPDFGDGSFETGWGDWYADRGVWQVGTPTAGPGGCHSGTQCAGTVLNGNYPAYTDSRLISPTITLENVSGAEEIHLRFWQWFAYYPYGVSYSNDYATVQISTDDGQTWTSVGNRIQDYSGGWSLNSIDLTAYAGQQVRIAFYHSEDPDYQSSGWYIDEVTIERFVPDFGDGSFETGWGDWYADRGVWQVGTPTAGPGGCHSGTQCAGTVLNGNYPPYTDSRLITPTITLPDESQVEEITLSFWQWFNYYPYGVSYSNDYATVQISTDKGQTWTNVGNLIQNYSGGWSLNSIDLTAYAGQQVRIAFFHSEDPDYQSSGWYIDDVEILLDGIPIGGDPNHPPTLSPIGNKSIEAGELLTFMVEATDPDDDGLTLTARNLPAGATFVDNGDGTGLFSWQTTIEDEGTYGDITFTATDDGSPQLSASETISITVGDGNQPPVLAPIGSQQLETGTLFTLPLTASDPDKGDLLSFSATDLPKGASLTDHGDGTAVFSWTPDTEGNFVVTFIVTDNGIPELSDSEEVTLTVGEVNRPPVLDPIGNQVIPNEEEFRLLLTATDPDGDTLSL